MPPSTSLTDEEQFLCARFVQHALSTDDNASEVLSRIASIGLLTEVVQDFVKPLTTVERTEVVVYLDAPVALELLGVSGKASRANTEPIVNELIRIGASVRVFGQSIDEMKNSLQAVLRNPRPTGPTARALMRGEVLKEYVVQVSNDPIPLLEKQGVRVTYRTTSQTPSEHRHFTDDDRNNLYSALTYAENHYARDHDADITTFVMRQRGGHSDRDLFKSRFFVLTRNGLLDQIAQRACVRSDRLPKGTMPPVLHRRVIAAAMWLRTGLGNNNFSIPKRMLLASCERVLAIRPGVVEAVKRLTDALGDEEKTRQLDLLISQDRSAQVLMDKTLGAPNVITPDNVSLLFQEMLHPYLEEERKKGREEVRKTETRRKEELSQTKEDLALVTKQQRESTDKLATLHLEDFSIVQALCSDVEIKLARRRKFSVCTALSIAALFCLPAILFPATWTILSSLVLVVLNFTLTFLTIIGAHLIGTRTSEKAALRALRSTAHVRRLDNKLEKFQLEWNGKKFVITDKITNQRSTADLFQ